MSGERKEDGEEERRREGEEERKIRGRIEGKDGVRKGRRGGGGSYLILQVNNSTVLNTYKNFSTILVFIFGCSEERNEE